MLYLQSGLQVQYQEVITRCYVQVLIEFVVIHWKHIVTVETDIVSRKCFDETDQLPSSWMGRAHSAQMCVECGTRLLCCLTYLRAHEVDQKHSTEHHYENENGSKSGRRSRWSARVTGRPVSRVLEWRSSRALQSLNGRTD